MNSLRMKERGINFFNKYLGLLTGYKLVFQEFLKDSDKEVFANIIKQKDSVVEGIIYEVDDSIYKLDNYEFIGRDYERVNVLVKSGDREIECITYRGVVDNLGLEKPPKKEYLKHLFKGKDFLSKKYYEHLLKTKFR